MKYFAQFLHNSTGYIPGTIPPKFSEDFVKPIPAQGSDSVYVVDGRWGERMKDYMIKERLNMLNKNLGRGYIGYQIIHGDRFTSNKIIKTVIL